MLNACIVPSVPATLQEYLNADSVYEAEGNELNYPVERLNSIAAAASLPDRQLSLNEG